MTNGGYRVIHRRNHAAAGITLLVAGMLILLSGFLPLFTVTGPSLGVLGKALGLTLTPNGSYEPDPMELWLVMGGIVMVFGLILLATRIRGLGILWRILAIIPILLMGAYGGYFWYFLSKPEQFIDSSDQGTLGNLIRGAASLIGNLGGYAFAPGVGLILLTAAVIIGIVAVFLPSIKSQRYAPLPGYQNPPQPYPPNYPPQNPPPYPQHYPPQYPQ